MSKMMNSRVFVGNLAAEKVTRQEVEQLFSEYGKVLGVSLHKSYGFVQFAEEECAKSSVKGLNGHSLHDLRLELNIATERRPPGGGGGPPHPRGGGGARRPGPPRSPPSPRFRGRFEPDRERFRPPPMDRYSRYSPPSPPPPPPPHYHDDPYYHDRRPPPPPLRDPYARPRDDLYDRYHDRYPPPGRGDFPPRDYPPPRDFPPPRRGPPPQEYLRELPSSSEPGSGDMEVIVVNRQQKEYAELVRSRIVNLGLLVEMVYLSPTVSLADALDNATQRGLLYAIIITSQHEMHRSTTLTILHGRNPQEHKNMPLEDALGLVDRDFIRYNQGVRDGHIVPRRLQSKRDVTSLLARAASGEHLDSSQLQAVISALQKQQTGPAAGGKPLDDLGGLSKSSTADIQRQQADLQAKILSLLGSRAVVPSATGPGEGFSGAGGGGQSSFEGGNSGGGYHDSGGYRGDPGSGGKYDSYGYGYR